MPHALRFYKMAKALGFHDSQAMCIANVVERSKGDQILFEREKIVDDLFDNGVTELMAEALAEALRHCFITSGSRPTST